MVNVVVAIDDNKENLATRVLGWLGQDFIQRGSPSYHFWHNHKVIGQAFERCEGLVAFDEKEDEIVGYLVWNFSGDKTRAEIDIVEVVESYRRQGVFKAMLAALLEAYGSIVVLTACHVLPQSEVIFRALGWQVVESDRQKTFYKSVKPAVIAQTEVPDGPALAVFSKFNLADPRGRVDFYRVKHSPEKYTLQYFPLQLRGMELLQPIIMPFHYEGYLGVFSDKKMLVEGKPSHLFSLNPCSGSLLVLASLAGLRKENIAVLREKGILTLPTSLEGEHARFFQPASEGDDKKALDAADAAEKGPSGTVLAKRSKVSKEA